MFSKRVDENIEIASFHESGHAVMAYIVGWTIYSIELEIENELLRRGITNYNFGPDVNNNNQINLGRRILCLMGGPIAESFFKGEDGINLNILGPDGQLIDNLLIDFLPQDRESIIQSAINQTATLLNCEPSRLAIKDVSSALVECYRIQSEEFETIMRQHKVPRLNF